MLVEFYTESITGDDEVVPIVILHLGSRHFDIALFAVLQFHGRSLVRIQNKLVFCHYMSGGQQSFAVLQLIRNVQQPFGALAGLAQVQLNLSSLLRSHIQIIYTAGTYHLTAFQYLPLHVIGGKVAEEVFIEHIDFTVLQVGRSSPDVLIDMPYFIHVRIGNTVRANQTIITEVTVAGIKTVKVTTIGINHLAVLSCPTYRLIDKIPDEATLVFGILANQIPIFFKTSFRVSHGMSIFTLNQGFCHGIILTVFLTSVIAIVHRAIDICLTCFTGLFILYGTARVFCLYPIVGGLEVRTIAGFVAKRPEDDAGMIETALHIALVALHMCFLIVRTLGKCLLAVAHSVRLDIRFCHYIDTVLVAKVIPKIVVGIMAGAHGVQVELLHHLNVLQHAFAGDDVTTVGVQFMTVGTLEENGLAVDKNLASFQFYLAEAYLYRNHFAATLQGATQRI